MKMNKKVENKAFTLIEAVVSIFIIVLISGLIFANYHQGGQQLALQRSANQLSQNLRRVQQMAMSVKDYNCPSGKLKGFGAWFSVDAENYSLKVRCDNGGYVDVDIEGEVSTKPLEKGVKIKSLSPNNNPLKIFFYPPDPEVDIGGSSEATITLSLKSDSSKIKKVIVNKIGLIEIK